MIERSGLERRIADALTEEGIEFEFESEKITYYKAVRGGLCNDCGSSSCVKTHTYLVDFYIPEFDFYIEAKGYWKGGSRAKHVAVRKANPEKDIRFIFEYDNWMTKKKKSRYTDWCKKNKFDYFVRVPGTKARKEVLLNGEWFK